ncbi:MAG: WYL domain-containing protein [Bacillota bacterium]
MSGFIIIAIIVVGILIIVSCFNRAGKRSCSDDAGVVQGTDTLPTTERAGERPVLRDTAETSAIYRDASNILDTLRFSPEFEEYAFFPAAKDYPEVRRLLAQCFSARRAVIIDYETGSPPQPFEPGRKIRAVEIYALGPNYFEAYCYYRRTTRTFRLDRVRGAMPTDRSYFIPASFVPGEWVRR